MQGQGASAVCLGVVLLAACGEVSSQDARSNDGPPAVDGRIDAAPPDAPPPRIIGNNTEFGEMSSHGANNLLGFQITVPTSGTLLRFGVIGKVAGPNAKMALYTEAAGEPSAFVGGTDPFPLLVGSQEHDAIAQVTVPAGRYWLMAVYDATAAVGKDMSAPTIKFRPQPFVDPFPPMFGTPMTYTGTGVFNYWIVIQ